MSTTSRLGLCGLAGRGAQQQAESSSQDRNMGTSSSEAVSVTPGKQGGSGKTRSRFSLRRLFYTNPLLSPPFSSRSPKMDRKKRSMVGGKRGAGTEGKGSTGDTQSEGWVTVWTGDNYSTSSSIGGGAVGGSVGGSSQSDGETVRECTLCLAEFIPEQFFRLQICRHTFCQNCLHQYVRIEIQEGRVNLKCPQCTDLLHPNDIELLGVHGEDKTLIHLYESLMLRRVLAADPDTRWCPAPNCTFAVVATGCASCPKIDCQKEGCGSSFCYHCKADWHPNQTCDMARAQRQPVRSSSVSFSQDSGLGGGSEVKFCPRCTVPVVKMDDGSCNHMTCAVCGSEFCWLCMKEISDLHYLSPSGCTFWGKKPWSRKKKILWQLGTLVGAPVGIALIAGIAIPAMIIGIPVWVGRKIHGRYQGSGKHRRNLAITGGVTASIVVAPLVAGLAVSMGVPCLLAYVYGVVPISLCRTSGCGVHTTSQVQLLCCTAQPGVRIDVDEEESYTKTNVQNAEAGTGGGSRVANPSIGEVSLGASLSLGSGSHLDRVGCVLVECDRESASNTAMAGHSLTGSVASSYVGHQRLEVGADIHPRKKYSYSFSSERLSETVSLSEKSGSVSLADDGASTRALAGSLLAYKMENVSVSSYRAGIQTPGSCGSATTGQGTPGEVDSAVYFPGGQSGTGDSQGGLASSTGLSGDEISLRSMPGLSLSHHPRSLSPVTSMSGEELTAAVRRSRRRQGFLDKQLSENGSVAEEVGSRAEETAVEAALDRVRFDDNVSIIEANSPDSDSDKLRTIKMTELETKTLVEETAEELAMVVSPQPRRVIIDEKEKVTVEVIVPELWSPHKTGVWGSGVGRGQSPSSPCSDNCDETPLLHLSSPSSDADCHNVSNISVMTDLTEASNVTSISIEHETCNFPLGELKVHAANDNGAYLNCEGKQSESLKIKIGENQDAERGFAESFSDTV